MNAPKSAQESLRYQDADFDSRGGDPEDYSHLSDRLLCAYVGFFPSLSFVNKLSRPSAPQ